MRRARSRAPLHVAHVTQNAPLELDLRPRAEAAALAAAGYRVTLVGGTHDEERVRELVDPAVSLRLYAMPPEARSRGGQVVEVTRSLSRAGRALLEMARRDPIDIVHSSNPPDDLWVVLPLLRVAQHAVPRFVFDQHDVAPVLVAEKYGRSRTSRAIGAIAGMLERRSFNRADLVVFANDEYARRARAGGLLRGRSAVVPNGWTLPGRPDPSRWRNGAGAVLAYVGAINEQDCVPHFVDAVSSLPRSDLLVWVAGDGAARADAERRARELGISDRFRWLGWVADRDELGSLVRTADVCVAPETDSEFNRLASFVKLVEYMSAGMPTAAHPLGQNLAVCGDTVEYAADMSAAALGKAIHRLLEDPERAHALGAAARRRFVTTIAWESVGAPRLVDAYRDAFGFAAPPPTAAEPSSDTSRR